MKGKLDANEISIGFAKPTSSIPATTNKAVKKALSKVGDFKYSDDDSSPHDTLGP